MTSLQPRHPDEPPKIRVLVGQLWGGTSEHRAMGTVPGAPPLRVGRWTGSLRTERYVHIFSLHVAKMLTGRVLASHSQLLYE
jgi:hypothetical protein